jgi:cell division protein FtsW
MTVFARTDTSMMSHWWWTVDRWMLLAIALLIAAGLLFTVGASLAVADRLGLDSFHFVYRQGAFLAFSVIVMFGISLMSPLGVRRLATVAFPVFFLLTLLTLVVGPEVKGSHRWLPLGSFTLQPSEFLKPAFVVVCAWMFSEQHKNPAFPGNRIAVALYLAVVAVLISQPDFGQTVLISTIWAAQFFMAGLSIFWVFGLAVAGVAGVICAYTLLPHVASRIDRFLDPSSGDTYQIDTALNAFRNGGLFGRGPGEGMVKRVLPDAHTDFIFAVAGEEFGVIICLVILGLFAAIVLRGLLRLLKESDNFIFLAAAGLLLQFGLQAFINVGVNLALLPAKGMTLPLISYGGSSLLSVAIGLGMVLALSRRQPYAPAAPEAAARDYQRGLA